MNDVPDTVEVEEEEQPETPQNWMDMPFKPLPQNIKTNTVRPTYNHPDIRKLMQQREPRPRKKEEKSKPRDLADILTPRKE